MDLSEVAKQITLLPFKYLLQNLYHAMNCGRQVLHFTVQGMNDNCRRAGNETQKQEYWIKVGQKMLVMISAR